MANIYEALQNMNFDGQAVQFLLESQGLSSDFTSDAIGTQKVTNTSPVDEDDLFQCGKCKKHFTSFQLFVLHKKEHKQGHTSKLHNSSVLSLPDESKSSTSETLYCQLRVDSLGTASPEIGNPIVFSENDILSFAVDQASLNMSTTTKETTPYSRVIQMGELSNAVSARNETVANGNLSEENDTNGKSYSIAILANQPTDFSSSQFLGSSVSTRLPSIHCLTKCTKMLKMEETVDGNNVKDVHFAAPVNEGASDHCEILLPDMDCSATPSDNRADELIHCEEVPVGSTETVLLSYSSDQTVKSCTNMLSSVEFAAIQDPEVQYTGCEVALENSTVCQNIVIDYTSDSIQSNTQDNVNEREDSRKTQPENVAVNKTTHFSSLLNPRLPSKNCGAEGTSQDLHAKMQPQQNSKSMLKCNFCTKLFTKNFDLQQHIRSHTGEKPFQCVVCGRAFAQKSNAKKHMQAHKVWPKDQTTLPRKANQLDGKENNADTSQSVKADDAASEKTVDYPTLQRSYACQFCDSTFSLYIELKSHMKKHSDQKVYKCIQKDCLQTFSDLESFLTHTNNAHVTGLQYRCHVCNKKFDNLESLGLHQYSHGTHAKSSNKSLTRGLVCYKCKRKFKTHAALEHHLDTSSHHFPCPCCGKVFTWERYLRRHLTTHGPEESYPCPKCGKCFRTGPYLKAHMLIHSETRPFVCQHCGATFSRRDKLTRHSLIHQAVKKYKCPFHNYLGCSREFSRQDKLKRHILTHTAAKPIRCKNCSKTFLRPSQLKEHEKLHCHKDRKQKCVDCGIVVRSKILQPSQACSSGYHEDSAKSSAINTTDNSSQNNEDEIKKQKVSLSQPKGARKNSKTRASFEVPNIHHQCNSISRNVNNMCRDSVSTIEIIVVPVSVSGADTVGNTSEEKHVCIIYPSEETNSVPSESNNLDNLRNSECENICPTRRKDCVENIPALKIAKSSQDLTDK
ncbi:zinc finger protein 761-like [Schistocerca gregaria]|uniref:zinc finger protein 761-like n=1 Tax=Schistocerca gregaria TaxID=7010 RepID=UPI00211ED97C|nr:zinc finger protein 761-like [Schistocerca gregaria]